MIWSSTTQKPPPARKRAGMLTTPAPAAIIPLPEDILTLGIDGVNQIWRDAKLRAVGKARAKTLIEAAGHSVGSKEGAVSARMEIRMLLEDYESRNMRLQEVMVLIEELVKGIPMAEKLLEIKGVGIRTVSGFLAEVGDISRFNNPKELQKLAGLALVENSSGKHKGRAQAALSPAALAKRIIPTQTALQAQRCFWRLPSGL